jgi:hypothetical protein
MVFCSVRAVACCAATDRDLGTQSEHQSSHATGTSPTVRCTPVLELGTPRRGFIATPSGRAVGGFAVSRDGRVVASATSSGVPAATRRAGTGHAGPLCRADSSCFFFSASRSRHRRQRLHPVDLTTAGQVVEGCPSWFLIVSTCRFEPRDSWGGSRGGVAPPELLPSAPAVRRDARRRGRACRDVTGWARGPPRPTRRRDRSSTSAHWVSSVRCPIAVLSSRLRR